MVQNNAVLPPCHKIKLWSLKCFSVYFRLLLVSMVLLTKCKYQYWQLSPWTTNFTDNKEQPTGLSLSIHQVVALFVYIGDNSRTTFLHNNNSPTGYSLFSNVNKPKQRSEPVPETGVPLLWQKSAFPIVLSLWDSRLYHSLNFGCILHSYLLWILYCIQFTP